MFDNSARGKGTIRGRDDGQSSETSPGKVTLTQRMRRGPTLDQIAEAVVQRLARGTAAPVDPTEIAARGVASGGSSLPHLDTIQSSFGRHDVSGVAAHQGGAAADAARDLDAQAYAFGSSVAFDGAPDLHTAAHEAAHVVQQRGGVQLRGNIGEVGDAHEVHADRVADAVVRGESAESLLDQYAGGAGASAAAIQRLVRAEGPMAAATSQRLLASATLAECDALRAEVDRAIRAATMVEIRVAVRTTIGGEDYELMLDIADARTLRDECVMAAMRLSAAPTAEAAPTPAADAAASPVAADPAASAPPGDAAANAELSRQVTSTLDSIPTWIELITGRIDPLTNGSGLTGIDRVLGTVVMNFGVARSTVDHATTAGAAVEAREMAFAQAILGMLPGLGDVAGMMAPTASFMEEVEGLGVNAVAASRASAARSAFGSTGPAAAVTAGDAMVPLGTRRMVGPGGMVEAGVGAVLSDARGDAASGITAPLTAAGPTLREGETSDQFALRAERSKTSALRSLLRCTTTGLHLAQIANQTRGVPEQLLGAEVAPEVRQLAEALIQLRLAWPNMYSGILALTHGVATAQEQLAPVETVWTEPQLEVYLWLLWMAALGQENSWSMHPDVIEDRLAYRQIVGPSSITGVDFGAVTTIWDTAEAAEAAHRYRALVLNALETYGAMRLP